MKAISIRAPWWWFILHAGKDIENRDWPTSFTGTVLIHASKWFRLGEASDDSADAMAMYRASTAALMPHNLTEVTFRQMKELGGHIVGSVEIIGCVQKWDSPWFQGKHGFVLRNPIAFANPYPVKGALGFFDVTPPQEASALVGRAPQHAPPNETET